MNNLHSSDYDMYFFNPFTRDLINLPRFGKPDHKFAFSCAPTMSTCVVFSICIHLLPHHDSISTWSPGAMEWVTESFKNQLYLSNGQWRNIVFSDGLFYCLTNRDKIGVFDPSARYWRVLIVLRPRMHHFLEGAWYVAEHKGHIFLIDAASSRKPVVFRLNRSPLIWAEKHTLKGSTIFASPASCVFKPELTGTTRNKVYFSKMPFNSTSCMSYSFDERRYFPDRTEGEDFANPQEDFNISAFTTIDSEIDISSIFGDKLRI
ncbi:unnamed protein product [Arabis nemorensis]|uniref:KIB1-4 beta-propeller domain-containing protein n=1 Tax=Arabis nemorensis TaxID=586526 RepID=A0A565CF86_9BRAS|nr:unnamed protein product [Arabis nemorensis]